MKNTIIPFAALLLLSLASCRKDPPPLDLTIFDVRWYDDDNSGTQTVGDALGFQIQVNTTDSDPDYQYISQWEFSYSVNDKFSGVLRGDEHMRTNTLDFDGEVYINNLVIPGPGVLNKGDVVEFRLWCVDNYGTEVERLHRYIVEE